MNFPQKFSHPRIHTRSFLDLAYLLFGCMQGLKVNRGSFYCKHTSFIFIITVLFYYHYYYYLKFLLYYSTFVCMLHLIMKVIVRRWFSHLGDSVPSVGRGCS